MIHKKMQDACELDYDKKLPYFENKRQTKGVRYLLDKFMKSETPGPNHSPRVKAPEKQSAKTTTPGS